MIKLSEVIKKGNIEIWYGREIETITKVEKNKPDILIWNNESNTCQLVEITVPFDTNVNSSTNEKDIQYICWYHNHRDCTKITVVLLSLSQLEALEQSLET